MLNKVSKYTEQILIKKNDYKPHIYLTIASVTRKRLWVVEYSNNRKLNNKAVRFIGHLLLEEK